MFPQIACMRGWIVTLVAFVCLIIILCLSRWNLYVGLVNNWIVLFKIFCHHEHMKKVVSCKDLLSNWQNSRRQICMALGGNWKWNSWLCYCLRTQVKPPPKVGNFTPSIDLIRDGFNRLPSVPFQAGLAIMSWIFRKLEQNHIDNRKAHNSLIFAVQAVYGVRGAGRRGLQGLWQGVQVCMVA